MRSAIIVLPVWVWSGAIALICAGAALTVWALLWDWAVRGRKRTTRRCAKCWYDMRGMELRCPECGRTARDERDLHRSRRHWAWAAVGAVLIVGACGPLHLNGQTYQQQAARLPSEVLLRSVDDACQRPAQAQNGTFAEPTFAEEICRELWMRDFRGQLTLSQRQRLARKQFSGSWQPLTLTTRSSWPAGVPMFAELRASFGGSRTRELRAYSPWPDAEVYTERMASEDWPSFEQKVQWWGNDWFVVPSPSGSSSAPVLVCLGTCPSGTSRVSLDVSINEGAAEIWNGVVHSPCTMVPTIDDAITPDASATITSAVAELFKNGLSLGEDRQSVGVRSLERSLAGLVVAVRIEFVHHDTVHAWASVEVPQWELSSRDPSMTAAEQRAQMVLWTPWAWARLEGAPVPAGASSSDGWSIRIVSDPARALLNFDATRYWKGSVAAPIETLIAPHSLRSSTER